MHCCCTLLPPGTPGPAAEPSLRSFFRREQAATGAAPSVQYHSSADDCRISRKGAAEGKLSNSPKIARKPPTF